ncbi:MAG TPA: hypothetical protein VK689_07065, partial [Armatimonadota bacterium]|nr:hypothetical protein [Armatimonadota bacterium]
MNVRRVRLISEPPCQGGEVTLDAPGARRLRGVLDRVRVRSVWLAADECDLRTSWGWSPPAESDARETATPRAAPATPPEPGPAE